MQNELKEARLLFVAMSWIYLVCAAGHVDTFDAVPSIETARAIVERQSLRLTDLRAPLYSHFYPAADGSWFTKLGLTLPVLYVIPVALAKVVAALTPFPESLLVGFFVSLVNGFLTAAATTLVFLFLVREGASRRYAMAVGFALGLATALFPYSKTVHREPFQALCLVGAFVFAAHPQLLGNRRAGLVLAGAFAALAFLTKQALIFPVLGALVYAACVLRRDPAARGELRWLYAPLALGLVLWIAFAWYAFGRPWRLGYSTLAVVTFDDKMWSTPLWKGAFQQLLSLDSLWFHSPVLLLAALHAARKAWRRELTFFELCVCGGIFLQIALHARWQDAMGGLALGPRYLVPVIPLFALLLTRPPRLLLPGRVGVALLVVYSLGLQAVQVAVKPQQYWIFRQHAESPLETPHWMANFKFFRHKWEGKEERYSPFELDSSQAKEIDLTEARSLRGYNFWWAHWRRSEDLAAIAARSLTAEPGRK